MNYSYIFRVCIRLSRHENTRRGRNLFVGALSKERMFSSGARTHNRKLSFFYGFIFYSRRWWEPEHLRMPYQIYLCLKCHDCFMCADGIFTIQNNTLWPWPCRTIEPFWRKNRIIISKPMEKKITRGIAFHINQDMINRVSKILLTRSTLSDPTPSARSAAPYATAILSANSEHLFHFLDETTILI